jgi:hypothetical protein
MKYSKEDKERARKLLSDLKPGDTLYTVIRGVAKSGMSREISLYQIIDNQPCWLGWAASRLLDLPLTKRDAIRIQGCGMDMGFHLVYSLSYRLFPNGFGIEGELPLGRKIRPTSKEMAAKAVSRGAKFYGRNGDSSGWDNDGGYALNQRWI